jgi:SAM-dependent methyltransferase
VGRYAFVRSLVESREFGELATIEALTRSASAEGIPFDPREPVGGVGSSERVIEVPWVLSRYRGEGRVLDVGYANAPAAYLALLLNLRVPNLHGVDLARRAVPRASLAQADARGLPYRDAAFDLALCVSTLEHIGLDNRRYAARVETTPGAVETLAEVARVLVPGGRLLVTVPFGRREDHGWFHQYDWDEWCELLMRVPLRPEEQATYQLQPEGWARRLDPTALADLEYGELGARAVLCASLVREP